MDEGQQPERLSAQGHLVQLTESIWLSCRWLYGPLRILRGKNWFIMHLRQRLLNMLARILPRASLLRNNWWQRSNCFQVRSSEVQYQTNELFGIFLNRITNVVNLELGNNVEKVKMDSFSLMSALTLVCFYENSLCYCWNVSWFEIQLLFFFFSTLLKQNVWRTSSSSIIDILQIHSRVDQLHNYPKILYVPRVYIGR